MARYDAKTKPTPVSPADHIASIDDDVRRRDAETLLALMAELTGEAPRMWGPSMIGFGAYHYRYDSGHEGDSFLAGFAARKSEMVVYLMGYISEQPDYKALLDRLGPHRMGKSCLYLRNLDKIDMQVLAELIRRSVAALREKYPPE